MLPRPSIFFLPLFLPLLACTTTSGTELSGQQELRAPPVVVSNRCGELLLQFMFERTSATTAVYAVYITDLAGQPMADASRVILTFTPVYQKEEQTVTLVALPSSQKKGMYAPKIPYTPSPGLWKIETVVRREHPPDVICTYQSLL